MLIDLNLIWKYHIPLITSKISKLIGIISRLRHFVTTNTLLTLYRPLILPYLSYGFTVWVQAAQTYLNQILVLQKHALYLIYFAFYWSHAIPLFVSSWSMMHDVFSNSAPHDISKLFSYLTKMHLYCMTWDLLLLVIFSSIIPGQPTSSHLSVDLVPNY